MWQDEFISLIEGKYICWDHFGEYIGTGQTHDQARQIVTEYVAELNKRKAETSN